MSERALALCVAADLDAAAAVCAGNVKFTGNGDLGACAGQCDFAVVVDERCRLNNALVVDDGINNIAGCCCCHQHFAACRDDRAVIFGCQGAFVGARANSEADKTITVKVNAEGVGSAELDLGEVALNDAVIAYGRRDERDQSFACNGNCAFVDDGSISVARRVEVEDPSVVHESAVSDVCRRSDEAGRVNIGRFADQYAVRVDDDDAAVRDEVAVDGADLAAVENPVQSCGI